MGSSLASGWKTIVGGSGRQPLPRCVRPEQKPIQGPLMGCGFGVNIRPHPCVIAHGGATLASINCPSRAMTSFIVAVLAPYIKRV